MGVPNFIEGSLISYESGDPRVPKILWNWGPGPLISYENRDPGSSFSLETGPPPPTMHLQLKVPSLVPRPFEGRRKGLVYTVCTCAKFTEIFLVHNSQITTATTWSGGYGQRILSTWSLLYFTSIALWTLQAQYFGLRLLYCWPYLLSYHPKLIFLGFKNPTKPAPLCCRSATV